MISREREISVFWFRRDLRLDDNTGLSESLKAGLPVLPIFIFDTDITGELLSDDPRISFIYDTISGINRELENFGSSILILQGQPLKVFKSLLPKYRIKSLYFNRDYEPYGRERDEEIEALAASSGIDVFSFNDHLIFEPGEILKNNGEPYTVYTPFKNKWLSKFHETGTKIPVPINTSGFLQLSSKLPDLGKLGFIQSKIRVREYDISAADNYSQSRDFPHLDATSYLGPHLRFGTISPRQVISQLNEDHEVFLSELVWREFFMQILFFFPEVVKHNFRRKYDGINWRNDEGDFEKWTRGETGYPMVDAGMRQLNNTGYMHNRVRMVAASFLCKHLLIHWQWGEAYFAEKLLDYELSSNNGNWQWAAGTGCDAAPYFRVFNPSEQLKKFDPKHLYISTWIRDLGSPDYPAPMVDHSYARKRALEVYKKGIQQ